MVPYQKEKIDNAICFFASEHRKKTRGPLYQTFLYKYLAFLDFDSVKKIGRPVLGLRYKAMDKGPVPIDLYEKRRDLRTPLYEFRESERDRFCVIPKGEPNLDYFSDFEINLMRRLIEIFASRFVKANLMSEASHQEIKAWKKTYDSQPNAMIDYISTFDNVLDKSDEELSYPEECYLTYLALEGS